MIQQIVAGILFCAPCGRTALTPAVLFELKRLLLIEDDDKINLEALCALGGGLEATAEDLVKSLTCLQRWVLTVVGPDAEKSWIRQPAPGEGACHSSAHCYLCLTFMTYGTCSHCYVGYRLTGQLNEEERLKSKGPRQKTKKSTALLTPTKDAEILPTKERKAQASQKATTLAPELKQLLHVHNLQQYAGLFSQYELTKEELKNWSLPSLIQLLGSPAGPTRRFLEAIKNNVDLVDQARTLPYTSHITFLKC